MPRELNKAGRPLTRNKAKPWRHPRRVESGGVFNWDKRDTQRIVYFSKKRGGWVESDLNVTGCVGDLVEFDPTYWSSERKIKIYKGNLGKFGRPKKKAPPKGHLCHKIGNPAAEYRDGMVRKALSTWTKQCTTITASSGIMDPDVIIQRIMASKYAREVMNWGATRSELLAKTDRAVRSQIGRMKKG